MAFCAAMYTARGCMSSFLFFARGPAPSIAPQSLLAKAYRHGIDARGCNTPKAVARAKGYGCLDGDAGRRYAGKDKVLTPSLRQRSEGNACGSNCVSAHSPMRCRLL